MRHVTDPGDFGRVAVVMGGDSAERDVSLDSGRGVLAALRAKGVEAEPVDGPRELLGHLHDDRFDRVFNILHGRGGEDGRLQGALDILGVPYTGSGVLGSAITMDKVRTKRVWQALGMPTPDFVLLMDEPDDELAARVEHLGMPLIVKPAREGSTLGLSKVRDLDELAGAMAGAAKFDAQVIVERFIDGPEYTASLLQDEALPLLRIEPAAELYDYEAKYQSEETKYLVPCGLESEAEHKLQALCMAASQALTVSGWARVDFMLDDDGDPWLLEVNTVPGMTSHSLVPMAAKAAGLDYETLVWRILETSMVDKP